MKKPLGNWQEGITFPSAPGISPLVKQYWINKMIKAEFLDIPIHVAYNSAHVVDRVICRKTDDGWQVMVKAHRNGKRHVAYINGATYADALELAGSWAYKGILPWTEDYHPPGKYKKRK